MRVQGNWMPCDLSDPSELAASFRASGRPSDGLLRFSYELSVTAYDFDVQRWYAAGWRDFSFRINDKLYTGDAINIESGGLTDAVKAGYYQMLARQKIRFASPIAQYKGTEDGRDHAKAVFMMTPCGEKIIIAIGFTGTCRRVDDWLPNLLMDEKEGTHAGFLGISREIWRVSSAVSFPFCARSLGADSLTLAHVIRECSKRNSRFLIWMTGHSQGGAVMQLFSRHLVRMGVRPENLLGCAFASPSVLWQPEICKARLCLVMNSDDMIPRFGARYHYGQMWMAELTDPDRKLCYPPDSEKPRMRAVLDFSRQIRTTEDALIVTCCLLEAVRDKDTIKAPQALGSMLSYMKVDPVKAMENRLDQMTDKVRARALRYYAAFTGRAEPDPVRYKRIMDSIQNLMAACGDAEFTRCLKNALASPHRIKNNESAHTVSPYCLICQTDGYPLRPISDLSLEIRPLRRYTASDPALLLPETHKLHLKQRRFLFLKNITPGGSHHG